MENETTYQQGDLVRFRNPVNEYEKNAVFVVREDRGPRLAVSDVTLASDHKGELLAKGWTVYATDDMQPVN